MLYQTTQEHEELRAKVREFAEAEVKPIAFMLDQNNQFPTEVVQKMGELFHRLGDPLFINRCQREGYQCENRPEGDCGLCRELSRIQKVLDGELRKTPLSAIFREK